MQEKMAGFFKVSSYEELWGILFEIGHWRSPHPSTGLYI